MDSIALYKCLGDETRLRILNLLQAGPLCVCHVQEALREPQSKISKQLAYMKRHGLLASRRSNNWTIYELAPARDALAEQNLRCLGEETFAGARFRADRARLARIDTSAACGPGARCGEPAPLA